MNKFKVGDRVFHAKIGPSASGIVGSSKSIWGSLYMISFKGRVVSWDENNIEFISVDRIEDEV